MQGAYVRLPACDAMHPTLNPHLGGRAEDETLRATYMPQMDRSKA